MTSTTRIDKKKNKQIEVSVKIKIEDEKDAKAAIQHLRNFNYTHIFWANDLADILEKELSN